MLEQVMTAHSITFGDFKWTGSLTTVDLIAAATNALNGALLARRPDHYKQFTVIGILLMAMLGGLGGGITRDVLLGQIPGALTNPAYITVALVFGIIGYLLAYGEGQRFREGFFQFMTAFSLPWYAVVGAQKGEAASLPILGCILLGIVGPTAGRYYIDLTSGVTAKQFIRSEYFVTTAALTALAWLLLDAAGLATWASIVLAFVIGFVFRLFAMFQGWEEPMPKEPRGVIIHRDHPAFGRKLSGKSEREMRDLGLVTEARPSESEA